MQKYLPVLLWKLPVSSSLPERPSPARSQPVPYQIHQRFIDIF